MVTVSKQVFGAVSRERAKLLKAQAAREELKLRQERRELVSLAVVGKTWDDAVMRCRSRLLALPGKAAPQVVGLAALPEVKALLDDLVYEALEELAADAGSPDPEEDPDAGQAGRNGIDELRDEEGGST